MVTLVTGGTGFVGVNIVKTLAERGRQVVCLDLAAADDMVCKYVAPWRKQITFVQGSILDKEALERIAAAHSIDKIVHAAVYTATRLDIEKANSRAVVEINIMGTVNLLELARGLSLHRFVYVSSGGVYGDNRPGDELLHEDVRLYPRKLYDVSKYVSEMLVRRHGELYGFPVVSTRLASPYGPMERVTGHRAVMSFIYDCTGRAVRGEPIKLSNPEVGRDYTFVADTAGGICAVLDAPKLSYDVYNVSNGHWVSYGEMAAELRRAYPSAKFINVPARDLTTVGPGGGRGPMDVTRLRNDVDFVARFDLAAGIREYLRWRETFPFRD